MTQAVRRIVTIGGGGHARVVIGLLQRLGFDVVGYTDDADRGDILSVPRIGNDTALQRWVAASGISQAALGVGTVDASPTRKTLGRRIAAMGLDFPVIISPTSTVAQEVVLGTGSQVCHGAVLNVGAVLGDFCIVNSNAVVEHDCRLGDNVHVAPGAVLSGAVAIGDDCMIGAGSTVLQQVSICPGTLVGTGSVVLRDITSPGVYVGNPVRRLR